jgi:hypothetical protein
MDMVRSIGRTSLIFDQLLRTEQAHGLVPGSVDKALNEIEADPTCIFWG